MKLDNKRECYHISFSIAVPCLIALGIMGLILFGSNTISDEPSPMLEDAFHIFFYLSIILWISTLVFYINYRKALHSFSNGMVK